MRALGASCLAMVVSLSACATRPTPQYPGPTGELRVYSITYAPTVEQSEYPVHTNYVIYTTTDEVIERVDNRTGPFYADPARVTLPSGEYHVCALLGSGVFVIVPVTIETGATTIVKTPSDRAPPRQAPGKCP